ncbi:MAG: hypothetical protein COA79_13525 [Planctomycetota bacterium]|nr:MAG: hypothetical protein COA79_13525 [Planctomycetota bacterium]
MKNTIIITLVIIILFSSKICSDDSNKIKLLPIQLPNKEIKAFTEKELIYFGSIFSGFQSATKHINHKFLTINLDEVIEGFKARVADKQLEIDSKELINVRKNFRLASTEKRPPDQKDVDKLSYFQGIQDATHFSTGPLPVNAKAFIQGVLHVKYNRTLNINKITQDAIFVQVEQLAKIKTNIINEEVKKEQKLFLSENSKIKDVVTTSSGLQYIIIKKGNGIRFDKGTIAKLNYRSHLINGHEINNTYKSKTPYYVHFNDSMFKGLRESLMLMSVGSSWEIYIPSNLAYNGSDTKDLKISPYSTIIYKIEVLDISKTEDYLFLKANKSKKDVITLPSGLQYKIIKKGTGSVFSKGQKIEIHYEGRVINDKVFDSSYKRNQTIKIGFTNRVIKGWQEILKLMKKGDLWEVYIPSELAYSTGGKAPNIKPHATLIFKMEVINIQ